MSWSAANRAPITERHVQAIWYDSSLRPAQLRTVRGGEVRVVDPGIWNLESGPDFRHAVLELGRDRRRVEGDVEDISLVNTYLLLMSLVSSIGSRFSPSL